MLKIPLIPIIERKTITEKEEERRVKESRDWGIEGEEPKRVEEEKFEAQSVSY